MNTIFISKKESMKLFEGLSVELSEDDRKLLEQRLNEEKTQWQKGAQNDEEFVQDIRNKTKGEMFNNFERWLKSSTGSKLDTINADLKGGERFKEMLNVAIGEVKSSKDTTNQELQDQLLEIKNQVRLYEEEKIPAIKQEYKQKFDNERIQKKLAEKMSEANVISDRKNPARIYLQAVMQDRYKLGWSDENSNVLIKTHKDLDPVINDKPADLDTVITHILDEGGFLKKSNGSPNGDPAHIPSPDGRSSVPKKGEFSDNAKKMAQEMGIEL